jgi:hypothetical protein
VVLQKGQLLEGNIQYYVDCKNTSYSYTDIHDTYTEAEEDDAPMYQAPVYVFPFIFGTTSNVILIIICNKDMRTVLNMDIINLAISDIIYLTVLFSEACANRISDTWLDGKFMGTFRSFCRSVNVICRCA